MATAIEPPVLRVYDINQNGTPPALRSSFYLPTGPSSGPEAWPNALNHLPCIAANRASSSTRLPFTMDPEKAIIALVLAPLNARVLKTYSIVIHLRDLMKLSDPKLPADSPDIPRVHKWDEWGTAFTRFLAWEPTRRSVRGSVFGSQYVRAVRTSDGSHCLVVLDFNPGTQARHQQKYLRSSTSEFLQIIRGVPAPASGYVRDGIKGETDVLSRCSTETTLPFVFDIAWCNLTSPYVDMDYEHLVALHVRNLSTHCFS